MSIQKPPTASVMALNYPSDPQKEHLGTSEDDKKLVEGIDQAGQFSVYW